MTIDRLMKTGGRRTMRSLASSWIAALAAFAGLSPLCAQVPVEGEVRQIVTFSFRPGSSAEAIDVFRERAVPLYEDGTAMLSFRGFREVESPIPLDLMVVSAFQGMAGMDRSNEQLREAAAAAGTSIGAIYGGIAALSSGHTDQFVEMLPALGAGDPSATRLTALVWYRVRPGERQAFENALTLIAGHDRQDATIPTQFGRFLVSDGWDYLQFLGFESLGQYQEYWQAASHREDHARLADLTVERRQVIVAPVPELAVREEDR